MDLVIATTCADFKFHELALTYKTFFDNLSLPKSTPIYINIDQYGHGEASHFCAKIASMFSDSVSVNIKEPNFPLAVKWCYEQTSKHDYVLSTEDDWFLHDRIDITKLISMLEAYDQVALRAYPRYDRHPWCLGPNIAKGKTLGILANLLRPDKNPEQWIRQNYNSTSTCFYPPLPSRIIIEDIGRQQNYYVRNSRTEEQFVNYEVKDGTNWNNNISLLDQSELVRRSRSS